MKLSSWVRTPPTNVFLKPLISDLAYRLIKGWFSIAKIILKIVFFFKKAWAKIVFGK